MTDGIIDNERTALAQPVHNQPDGPGKRIEKRSELFLFGKVVPGGARLFYQRLPQFQAEAAYWEARVGTVHDLRITLIDDDTRILFAITFDGDFKPYIEDILKNASPWFDALMPGVWDGFVNAQDPSTIALVLSGALTSDFFYCSNPELSVRDITRLKRIGKAVEDLLDAAN